MELKDLGELYKIRIGRCDTDDWEGWHLAEVQHLICEWIILTKALLFIVRYGTVYFLWESTSPAAIQEQVH